MAMTLVLSSSLVEMLNTAHETKLSKMKGTTEVPFLLHYNEQTSTAEVVEETKASVTKITTPAQESKTKAQKRREQNNWQKVGELPRGYNWVDLVSHLRKTADSKAQLYSYVNIIFVFKTTVRQQLSVDCVFEEISAEISYSLVERFKFA